LTATSAEASRTAGAGALVGAELSSVTPLFIGADQLNSSTDEVVPGVVHLAVPFDTNWHLTVDGTSIEPRRAFGVTTGFDIETAGTAVLEYRTETIRPLLIALQVLMWALALFAATRVSIPFGRRGRRLVEDETLIDFDEALPTAVVAATIVDPGLDMSGEISRGDVDEPRWDVYEAPEDLPRIDVPDAEAHVDESEQAQ
jgi:hypothetical protein